MPTCFKDKLRIIIEQLQQSSQSSLPELLKRQYSLGGKWGWLDSHSQLTHQQTPQGKLPPQTPPTVHQRSTRLVSSSPPMWGQLTSPPEERTAAPVSDRREARRPLMTEQWAHSKAAEHRRYPTVSESHLDAKGAFTLGALFL